jgi:hypothetical protein
MPVIANAESPTSTLGGRERVGGLHVGQRPDGDDRLLGHVPCAARTAGCSGGGLLRDDRAGDAWVVAAITAAAPTSAIPIISAPAVFACAAGCG